MFRPVRVRDASWRSYLQAFHRERPGITERVLERCRDEAGDDPYRWIAAAIDADASVLDLACGSGPLAGHCRRWVGLDLSTAELGEAAARGASPLVAGDATNLPFGPASFDTVACSMALMITQPLPQVLREIARVLRPGGQLVAMLPTTRPLRLGDLARYSRLLFALRRTGFGYPNDEALADAPDVLERAGLTPIRDERRRFTYPIVTTDDSRQLVASLYLPGIDATRIVAADRVGQRWVGSTVGVPLRRIIARGVGSR